MNERLMTSQEGISSNDVEGVDKISRPSPWILDVLSLHASAVESRHVGNRRVAFISIMSGDSRQQWTRLEGEVNLIIENTNQCIFCGEKLPVWNKSSLSTREKLGLWTLACKNCIPGDFFKPCVACEAGMINEIVDKGLSPASLQEAKEVVQWNTCKKILLSASINVSSLRCLKNHVLILYYHDREEGPLLEWNILVEGECENAVVNGGAMACMIIRSKDVILDIFSILELVFKLQNAIEPHPNSSKMLAFTREGDLSLEDRISELERYIGMIVMQGHHVDGLLDLNHGRTSLRGINHHTMFLGSRICKMFQASSKLFQIFSWMKHEIKEYNKKHPFQFEIQLHLPMNLEPCFYFQEHVIPGTLGGKLEGKIVHSWGKWAIMENEGPEPPFHAIDLRELIGKRIKDTAKWRDPA